MVEIPEDTMVQIVVELAGGTDVVQMMNENMEGYSYRQIAEHQGCSHTTVRRRLNAARQRLTRAGLSTPGKTWLFSHHGE